LTFKLPDLGAAIDGARAIGIEPVGIDRTDPGWQEAFLHPKQAFGIVVQLAQADHVWDSPPPSELPVARAGSPATLTHVTHLVADLAPAIELFAGLLGGQTSEPLAPDFPVPEEAVADLAWPGPGRLRLLQPAPGTAESAWLGHRAGRLHHIAFTVPDPAVVRDAVPTADGRLEVAPERNAGVRLVLTPGPVEPEDRSPGH
jgi:methylmalonyl-CoA/ethylmalonyl-CoA epimerase